MKIAVTGASGQFGRALAELLLQNMAPSDLILVSRKPASLREFAERGCIVRQGDFDDAAGLEAAFADGDRLMLISGTRVGFRLPQHGAAIEAARRAGIGQVVYTSFIGAGDPENQSEAVSDHRGTEALMRDSGLAWTALRDAQYADAVTDVMVYSTVQNGVMLSVAGDGRMPFVWRDDCVAAAAAVLLGTGHENRAYNITGPELVSFREVGQLIGEFTGQDVRFELTDPDGLYAMFDAIGVPRQPVEQPAPGAVPWNSDDMVSFEVAVRDGCFAVESNDFQLLTGRPPRSLRALFEAKAETIRAHFASGSSA